MKKQTSDYFTIGKSGTGKTQVTNKDVRCSSANCLYNIDSHTNIPAHHPTGHAGGRWHKATKHLNSKGPEKPPLPALSFIGSLHEGQRIKQASPRKLVVHLKTDQAHHVLGQAAQHMLSVW